MTRWKKPTIGKRCPKVWTPADDRALRANLELLRGDIRSAGGFQAWLDTRIEDWIAPPACPAVPRQHA